MSEARLQVAGGKNASFACLEPRGQVIDYDFTRAR